MKYNLTIIYFLVTTSLVIEACNFPSPDQENMTEALAAIDQVRKNHVEAVNSTDVEFALQDMSDSLVYLAPGLPPIEGKQALRDFITPIYEISSINIEMIPKDIEIVHDTAIEWGIITGHFRTAVSDSLTPVHNKYLFVYQKNERGKWLITHDIYNVIIN